jgi:hypothetical protein
MKNLITRKVEQKTLLVLDKSERDRIQGHVQFLHKDAEYEDQQMLQEKLKDKSILMVKDWEKTRQVRNACLPVSLSCLAMTTVLPACLCGLTGLLCSVTLKLVPLNAGSVYSAILPLRNSSCITSATIEAHVEAAEAKLHFTTCTTKCSKSVSFNSVCM